MSAREKDTTVQQTQGSPHPVEAGRESASGIPFRTAKTAQRSQDGTVGTTDGIGWE